MTDRIPCIVPFCKRTAPMDKYPPGTRIICAKHYRSVSPGIKAERRKVERNFAKIDARYRMIVRDQKGVMHPAQLRAWRRMRRRVDMAWAKIEQQAIERAMGI